MLKIFGPNVFTNFPTRCFSLLIATSAVTQKHLQIAPFDTLSIHKLLSSQNIAYYDPNGQK